MWTLGSGRGAEAADSCLAAATGADHVLKATSQSACWQGRAPPLVPGRIPRCLFLVPWQSSPSLGLELLHFGFPFAFTRLLSYILSLPACVFVVSPLTKTPVIGYGACSDPVRPHLDLITFADCTHKVTFPRFWVSMNFGGHCSTQYSPSSASCLPQFLCPSHIQNKVIPAQPLQVLAYSIWLQNLFWTSSTQSSRSHHLSDLTQVEVTLGMLPGGAEFLFLQWTC